MNLHAHFLAMSQTCFRPQQGLSIMNLGKRTGGKSSGCFRPQQGLSIMNQTIINSLESLKGQFPSPTGVKYYEYLKMVQSLLIENLWFPSPTGVKYYE